MAAKKLDGPPLRPCDLCGGVDQDPRHSFAGLIGAPDNTVFDPLADVRPVLDANVDAMVKKNKLSITEAFAVKPVVVDAMLTLTWSSRYP